MEYIELRNVTKRIKKKLILDNINLKLKKGQIIILSGSNGSGKTMLLRAISGLIKCEGEIYVNENKIDVKGEYPETLGVVIESSNMIPEYSGLENLKYLAEINGNYNEDVILRYMKKFEIYNQRNEKLGKYSLGMKRKIEIIQAIMEEQNLILLDEPTNALDKKAIETFLEIIGDLKSRGKTVIIASHDKLFEGYGEVEVQMYEGKIVDVLEYE